MVGIETEWRTSTGKVEAPAYIVETLPPVGKRNNATRTYVAGSASYTESTDV